MKKNMIRALIIAICSVGVLGASGYTPYSAIEVVLGVILVAGAMVFAIRALIIGRDKIIGPERAAPESGLLQNGMRALAPTIITAALIVMSGYLRNPNNMVMIILIVLFLLISSAYWTWAIVKYRQARQDESGE